MSDGELLLKAILSNPAEDTPRLVYADWLDENGQTERAAFIRTSIKIWRMPPTGMFCEKAGKHSTPNSWVWSYTPRCRCGTCTLARRNYNAGKRHTALEWRDGIPVGVYGVWRRGMVERVELPCAEFLAHAVTIFASHPVVEVRLTDRRIYDNHAYVRSNHEGPGHIPKKLFRLWSRLPKSAWKWRQIDREWMYFPTQDDADVTVSAMCVAYGRRLAGLPPL